MGMDCCIIVCKMQSFVLIIKHFKVSMYGCIRNMVISGEENWEGWGMFFFFFYYMQAR